jgi:hypothetical protein
MSKIDITEKIERLEAFEERSEVILESLSVFLNDDGTDSIPLKICGELLARNGTELQQDIELVVSAYDESGRVIKTCSKFYNVDSFFGLEIFEVDMILPIPNVSKIRIYPKNKTSSGTYQRKSFQSS